MLTHHHHHHQHETSHPSDSDGMRHDGITFTIYEIECVRTTLLLLLRWLWMRKAKGQLCVTRASSTQFQHHQCDTDTGRRRRRSRCWNRMPAAFMHPISMRCARSVYDIIHTRQTIPFHHACGCCICCTMAMVCSGNIQTCRACTTYHTYILRLQYARLARKRVRTQSNSQPHHTRFMRARLRISSPPLCFVHTSQGCVCVFLCSVNVCPPHILYGHLKHSNRPQ